MTDDENYRITEKDAILSRLTDDLAEHFDNVLVMVAWRSEDGKTEVARHQIRGGYYGGVGLAQAFMQKDNARVVAFEIIKAQDEEDEL